MAHRFSASINRADPVSPGAAYCEMLAGATKSISVRSIRVIPGTNTGGMVALTRSFAVGTGAATGIGTAVAHHLSSPTTSARVQVAWTNSGVAPTGFGSRMREHVLQVATGEGIELWKFDDGPLTIEPLQSLLVINHGSGIQASGSMRFCFTWEEGPLGDT